MLSAIFNVQMKKLYKQTKGKAKQRHYEEIKVDLANREHLTPEFAEINPMQQLPAIVHGSFKLFE
ncbi:hypothetical protein Godav_026284, partial [Gossypium davidsonii]|nr:hypothetical protein [Gossypium davidsonii]